MIYAPISAVGVLLVFSASYFTASGLLVCVPMDEHRDFINDTRFDYYKEDYAIITVKLTKTEIAFELNILRPFSHFALSPVLSF